jgi:hypothetical protein
MRDSYLVNFAELLLFTTTIHGYVHFSYPCVFPVTDSYFGLWSILTELGVLVRTNNLEHGMHIVIKQPSV